LEHGISVLLTGGDLPHVGAVSVADPNDGVHTIVLCGHKDQYIGEVWARQLCEKTKLPVSVTVGIHYNRITKSEIEEVQMLAQEMLEDVLEALNE
jgi:hypothetical protein